MRHLPKLVFVSFFLFSLSFAMEAGTSPCSATKYQLSDFGNTKTYNLDNGTYTDLADPSCGDYQGQDFWVEFTGPNSGLINIELLDGTITDAAFEVYWNACSGLATSVGCFSNRNCGQVPMPGANLEVIPGETYHVRIYQEGGGAGSLGYRMSDLGGNNFILGGSATDFDAGTNQNCIELTSETNGQVGCAWFDTAIDFSSGFEINYQLYFGDKDANGADGISFVFHLDPTPPCNGSNGGSLGIDGLGNSFIVEFDTWFNSGNGDILDDHVAINLDGGFFNFPLATPVSIGAGGNVEDGEWHDVQLKWDPVSNVFQVYFDGVLKISQDVGLITDIFAAGSPIYWGLVGTTGGSNNNQRFCFEGFTVENSNSVENKIEAKICAGDPYVFGASNQVLFDAGEYIEVFRAANGCDSTVTLTLEIVDLEIIGIEEVELPCGDDASVVQLAALVNTNVEETNLSYEWTTDDGSFDSGEETLTPIVSSVGTYTLAVETGEEGCEEEFTVVVTTAQAPVVFGTGGYPECGTDTLTLSCNSDSDVEVSWSTTNGSFLGDSTIHNPVANGPGIYTVTVTDINTGCTSTAQTEVLGGAEGDSGPDFYYCADDVYEVILEGSISGDNVLSYQWEPSSGLYNSTSLTPGVRDVNYQQNFNLIVCSKAGQNLITNGTFELGDNDFTSDYISGSGTPGEYLVTDDPTSFFGNFPNCEDHSEIDDLMMVVDGHQTADQNVWCQEVEVETDKEYVFSAWFTALCQNCGSNPPVISYTLDGVMIDIDSMASVIIDSDNCEWEQYNSEGWTPVNPVVEICITDLTTSSNGNDFALDDIELYEVCCIGSGSCGVYPSEELFVEIPPVEIGCQPDQIVDLNAMMTGAIYDDVFWFWNSTDGNIISNTSDLSSPTAQVQGPGTYTVIVGELNNYGCTASASVEVTLGNPEYPDFSLQADSITCFTGYSTVFINGFDLDFDYNASFDVSYLEDNSVDVSFDFSFDEPGLLSFEAFLIGFYNVTITNTDSGCETVETIEVRGSLEPPDVNISFPETITCDVPFSNINIDAPAGADYSYDWSTTGGDISSGQNSQQIVASQAGDYQVIVTDNISGCMLQLDATVLEDTASPEYSIGTPGLLDCINNQAELSVSGIDLSYEWLANSNIVSGLTNDNITVTDAGQYEVIVTNNASGCTEIVSVSAQADFAEPDVDAGDPYTFGCADSSLSLSGSSSNSNTTAEWQTAGGVILSGGNTFNPSVGGAGVYTLTVTGENGCTNSDSVEVSADIDLPIVTIANSTYFINCNSGPVSIDATASSTGSEFIFTWSDQAGNPISEFATLNPSIEEAGEYQLTIVNTSNACEATTFVEVVEDFAPPVGDIIQPTNLACNASSSTFGLELNNPDWTYQWTSESGELENENQFQIETSTAGSYILVVTSQLNGCPMVYDFTLNSSEETPTLAFGGNTELSCIENELDLSVSTDAENPTFEWSTTGGNILTTNTDDNIQVNEPGDYAVTITDGANGCTATGVYTISQNADQPLITISMPENITCDRDEVILTASVDNGGSNLEYSWSTEDGILNTPNDTENIAAGSAGTYSLTVLNPENGCTSSSDILVEESISTFLAEIDQPSILDCDITEVMLTAASVSGSNIEYVWTTNGGNIVSGEDNTNPLVNQAGEYILTITDLENGCTAEASITVEQDGNLPIIEIEPTPIINCENEEVTLNAAGSSIGVDFLVEWNAISGNLISGQNGLSPTVNEAGTYELTITNQTNNCRVTQEVTVEMDMNAPEIDVLPFGSIDCSSPSVSLQCVYNGQGLAEYVWLGPSGFSSNESSIEVNEVGAFIVVVTSLDNGCTSTLDVVVEGSESTPDVSIIKPQDLDCDNLSTSITLDLPMDSEDLRYTWGSADGQIDGPTDESEISVLAEGNYSVTVTDIVSNCEVVLSAFIKNSIEVPALDYIIPDTITCINPKAVINTQTDQNGLIYSWETLDGLITSATNGEDVVAGSAGLYTLTVVDPTNNCTNQINVEIFADVEYPTIDLQSALELNCLIMEQSLSADGSSVGEEFAYQWTSQSGQFISGQNTLFPLISAPGYYVLEVTNTENNCTILDSILINENTLQPLAQIMEPMALDCINDTISIQSNILNSPSLILEWTTVGGSIISDPSLSTIMVDGVGVYQFDIFDTTNGCTNSNSTIVVGNTEEPILSLSPGFTITCDNQSGSLMAEELDPLAQLSWFNSQNESIATSTTVEINEPGIYSAIALFPETGCQTIQTVEVLLNGNVPTELITAVDAPLCFGDEAMITIIEVQGGDAPYLYSTDGGQSFGDLEVLENLAAGSVQQIIVQDVNGCDLQTEVVIPEVFAIEASLPPLIELNLGDSYEIQVQTNIPLNDIESIVWTPTTGLSCTDCLNPTLSGSRDITYQVEITTNAGCNEFADIQFRVDQESSVYIPNAFSPSNLDGFNDSFYIYAKEDLIAKVQSLQVYDRWGNQVFINEDFPPNESAYGWNGQYRGKRMQTGVFVYFTVVEYFDGSTELFKGNVSLIE